MGNCCCIQVDSWQRRQKWLPWRRKQVADEDFRRLDSEGAKRERLNDYLPRHKRSSMRDGRNLLDDSVSKEMMSSINRKRIVKRDTQQLQNSAGLGRVDHVLRNFSLRGSQRPIDDFYEKLSVLGEGAFGKVTRWRTKNPGEVKDEEVAVKHIGWKSAFGTYWVDQSHRNELVQELKMLMILDSPYVAKVREWFEHSWKGIYFVMELCTGGSLQDLLEEVTGCVDTDARRKYAKRLKKHFREVTYALAYLHGMEPPIVHRDLKPDNALMKSESPDTCIKLIDFGLTILAEDKLASDSTWTQGTQVFMSPEQFLEPTGKVTEAIDIWALGVILGWITSALELGSLQHPVLDEDEGKAFEVRFSSLRYAFLDMQEKKKTWNKELFSTAPAPVVDLLDQLLLFEPKDRLSASKMLDHPWLEKGALAKEALKMDHTSLFANIRSYSLLDKFDRIILNLVASSACTHGGGIVGDRVLQLRRVFQAVDTGHNGVLTEAELINAFHKLYDDSDDPITDGMLRQLYMEMDVDGSGAVDYSEFLAAAIGSAILSDENSISSAFRGLDSTQTGEICFADLMDAMGEAPARSFLERRKSTAEDFRFSYEDFRLVVQEVAAKRMTIPISPTGPNGLQFSHLESEMLNYKP